MSLPIRSIPGHHLGIDITHLVVIVVAERKIESVTPPLETTVIVESHHHQKIATIAEMIIVMEDVIVNC